MLMADAGKQLMKLPYGVRDFDKLITDGYLYVDRTDRIPLLERLGSDLLFLRLRRFGKSLWLSTLMNYYDLAAEVWRRLEVAHLCHCEHRG
jgi:hypothetical protein